MILEAWGRKVNSAGRLWQPSMQPGTPCTKRASVQPCPQLPVGWCWKSSCSNSAPSMRWDSHPMAGTMGKVGGKSPRGLSQKAGGKTSGNRPSMGSQEWIHSNKRSQEHLVGGEKKKERIKGALPPQFWQFPDGKLKWNFFECSETFWTSLVFISYGSAQKKVYKPAALLDEMR